MMALARFSCSVFSPFTWASTMASRPSSERRSGLSVSQYERTLSRSFSALRSATRAWPLLSAAGLSMRPSAVRTSRIRLVSPPNFSSMTFPARLDWEAGSS